MGWSRGFVFNENYYNKIAMNNTGPVESRPASRMGCFMRAMSVFKCECQPGDEPKGTFHRWENRGLIEERLCKGPYGLYSVYSDGMCCVTTHYGEGGKIKRQGRTYYLSEFFDTYDRCIQSRQAGEKK